MGKKIVEQANIKDELVFSEMPCCKGFQPLCIIHEGRYKKCKIT